MSAPKPGPDLRLWAEQIVQWLGTTAGVLTRKQAGTSAAQDGNLFWDRANGYPVVTRSGAFVRLSMQVEAPATQTSAGEAGQWAYDASYFYVCVATDTWKRIDFGTWL